MFQAIIFSVYLDCEKAINNFQKKGLQNWSEFA